MVLVFDVNETLLDLAALDPHFEKIFGDSTVRKQWFALVLRNALTLTVLGEYQSFTRVGAASLAMVAEARGVALSEQDRAAVAETMAALPPHSDVVPNLKRLGERYRLATLTNSPRDLAVAQLTSAGIAGYFEEILSVDAVGRLKPAREVYVMAAERLGGESPTLIAAHDWDVAGAMAVGWRGALVTRPGAGVNPLLPPPDIIGPDLDTVGDRLLTGAG